MYEWSLTRGERTSGWLLVEDMKGLARPDRRIVGSHEPVGFGARATCDAGGRNREEGQPHHTVGLRDLTRSLVSGERFSPRTAVGTERLVLVSSPSCPRLFLPQHITPPSEGRAQLW